MASILWEAAAERRPDPVQLGSDGNQDHCSATGGRRPCCGADAGYTEHLAPINSQAKEQASMWVQMKRQGPRAGGTPAPTPVSAAMRCQLGASGAEGACFLAGSTVW